MWLDKKIIFLLTLICFSLVGINSHGLKEYHFVVKEAHYRRLCSSKPILTVNGQFPGPIIRAYYGETIFVNVHNKGKYDITLHLKEPYDGMLIVTGQEPLSMDLSIFIQERVNSTLFPHLMKKFPLYKNDARDVYEEFLRTGGAPNDSDAITINGQPGDLYACKIRNIELNAHQGKTYLLRMVNAAMNLNLFFSVSKHHLTVLQDKQLIAFGVSFNNGTTTARIHYDENHAPNKSLSLPYLPYYNDKEAAFDYYVSIKGLTETYPYQIPKEETKVALTKYGSTVELVFQWKNLVAGIDHPMHLHGTSFFAVGYGFGNFDIHKDHKTYNLIDPPIMNTILVPKKGWASIKYRAANPGMWHGKISPFKCYFYLRKRIIHYQLI
ncbi:Laccase-15 [Glycine max]|nr:Laccase-15 [Glycine max]